MIRKKSDLYKFSHRQYEDKMTIIAVENSYGQLVLVAEYYILIVLTLPTIHILIIIIIINNVIIFNFIVIDMQYYIDINIVSIFNL